MDTRLVTLVVWGGGVVVLFGIVLVRRVRAYNRWRDRAALRETIEAIGLFLTSVAAGASIMVVLAAPDAIPVRTFFVLLSLGGFAGVGVIMATEEPRARPRREVRKRDGVSPPYDAAGNH